MAEPIRSMDDIKASMLEQQADNLLHQEPAYGGDGHPQFYMHSYLPTGKTLTRKVVIHCPNPHPGRPVIACVHCMDQDEQHPVGITITERGILLCPACLRLHDRHRLSQDSPDMRVFCWHCLLTEINRIRAIDPTKFFDRRPPQKRLYFEDETQPKRIVIPG